MEGVCSPCAGCSCAGRAVPAAFRRDSGELEYYLLQENGSMGGTRALLADRFLINGGCFLEQETGKLAARAGRGVLPRGFYPNAATAAVR